MKALIAAILLFAATMAQGQMTVQVPDVAPVSGADERAIRAALGAYVTAIRAGDRDKALQFCVVGTKEQEKVVKLAVEGDLAVERLRLAVHAKFGAETWKSAGEALAELTPEVCKSLEIKPTPSVDEVKVNWSEKSTLPREKRLGDAVSIRRTRSGWKIQCVEEGQVVPTRRWLRDLIAEIDELTASIKSGQIRDGEAFSEALARVVREAHNEKAPETPPAEAENAPVPEVMPAPNIECGPCIR